MRGMSIWDDGSEKKSWLYVWWFIVPSKAVEDERGGGGSTGIVSTKHWIE